MTTTTTPKPVKCYSVRLVSLVEHSEKAYKATDFQGNSEFIPKSQCYGQDYERDGLAYWISEWILSQKKLQFSDKKESFFDRDLADSPSDNGVTIERHVPDAIEAVDVPIDESLTRTPNTYFTTKKDLRDIMAEKAADGTARELTPKNINSLLNTPLIIAALNVFPKGSFFGDVQNDYLGVTASEITITGTRKYVNTHGYYGVNGINSEGVQIDQLIELIREDGKHESILLFERGGRYYYHGGKAVIYYAKCN